MMFSYCQDVSSGVYCILIQNLSLVTFMSANRVTQINQEWNICPFVFKEVNIKEKNCDE